MTTRALIMAAFGGLLIWVFLIGKTSYVSYKDKTALAKATLIPSVVDLPGLKAQVATGLGPIAFDLVFKGDIPNDTEARFQCWWSDDDARTYFRTGTARRGNIQRGDRFEVWYFPSEGMIDYDPRKLTLGIDVYLTMHGQLTRPLQYILIAPSSP